MTIEQVAEVFEVLNEFIKEGGGSYRYLIYDKFGFGFDAYTPLYLAGGMNISNTINEALDKKEGQ